MPEIPSPTVLARIAILPIFLLVVAAAQGQFTVMNQPPVSNRPYPRAYYNQKLPNAGSGGPLTHLMPNSANVVGTVMRNGGSSLVTGSGAWNTPGLDDGNHAPLYYGQASDPVYQISGCTGANSAANGEKFHAPNGALYSQASYDRAIAIWDLTTNDIIGLYGGAGGPKALPACSGTSSSPCNLPAYGGYCSLANRVTGSGVGAGGAASTAGLAPFGNKIMLTEIAQVHHINHGLRLISTCTDTNNGLYPSKTVFPATQPGGTGANTCTNAGVSASNRPPNGSLFFLDYTQSQLDCFDPSKSSCPGINKLATWQFAILEAMTLYGGTLEDTGNNSSLSTPGIESEQAYAFYEAHGVPGAQALADAFTHYMNANCSAPSCSIVTRSAPNSLYQWSLNGWAGISNVNGGDIIAHMHVADPCVATGLQGLSGGCASPSATPASQTVPAPTGLTATVH